MLYSALVFFVAAVVTLILGFAGVVRGASGVANLALVAFVVMLGLGLASSYRRPRLHH